MQDKPIWKFRWFWAWQDEKEEAWLESMSRQGWHLDSLCLPGFYRFKAGEHRNLVYRLDFKTTPHRDWEEYLQLFQDAGWEHIGQLSAWQYFRKEALPGETPEIFTDPESKIEKYRRLLGFLIIFLPIWVVLLSGVGGHYSMTLQCGSQVFAGLMVLLFLYAFVNLLHRINQLKRL